jgi:hypothetical protein
LSIEEEALGMMVVEKIVGEKFEPRSHDYDG